MTICNIEGHLHYQTAARKVKSIFIHSDGKENTALPASINERSMYYAMDDFTYNEVDRRDNGDVPVPEPGVIFLLGIGLLSIYGIRRKR